ncbi:MAG TPA: PspC domain-containing protein [Prolixibacteraceae bacterium]|nr:PspC domain-containing protein [Prolixibacteraceae bacterium]
MKKTFTINISGSVFHIEEDAFEKLQNYLQLLNSYFGRQVGGQEILQDIESRIAELLQEKINEGQEAVTSEWVDEVMQRMGKPEDFSDPEQTDNSEVPHTEANSGKTKKRMYRDIENRVLGGVCSGMSAYFNIDPVFLRILFVLLVFIGVGISAIVYLILWIVVPKAQTTAQRLEMRGEEATISNIRKTIQEEVTEVKKNFSKINQSDSVRKGKEVVSQTGRTLVQAFKGLGKAVGVIFGSLLILTGFVGFVTFLVSMAIGNSVFQSHSAGLNTEVDLSGILGFMVSPGLVSVSILLLVLLIGIPLLVILFIGTKLVFRYKTNNKLIGLGAFGIWLVALVSMIAITAGQISNFSQKNTVSTGTSLNCPTCKTLYLELGTLPEKMDSENNISFEDFTLVAVGGEKVLAGNPRLRIEATDATDFSVVIRKQTRGKNAAEIQGNLNRIQYNVTSKDSTLLLDPYFTIENQAKWRNQEVQITVKVPTGKMIHLDTNLGQLHFDFENINNIWNKDMTGKTWIMTPEGLSLKE